MNFISPDFINGPIKKLFEYKCLHTQYVPGCLALCTEKNCPTDYDHELIRTFIFSEYNFDKKNDINRSEFIMDWNRDIYPILTKMTPCELYKKMIEIKNEKFRCEDCHICDIIRLIDSEIKLVNEKRITIIEDQICNINDKLNILCDWINI
jgi:hypothetical protein